MYPLSKCCLAGLRNGWLRSGYSCYQHRGFNTWWMYSPPQTQYTQLRMDYITLRDDDCRASISLVKKRFLTREIDTLQSSSMVLLEGTSKHGADDSSKGRNSKLTIRIYL